MTAPPPPPPPELPAGCRQLADAGRFYECWQRVAAHWPALVRNGTLDDCLWLHELCLRLGYDVRRRWLGRAIARRFGDRLPARACRVRDLLRQGRWFEAWLLAQQPPPPAPADETADWLLARARVHTQLRDHGTAASLLEQARGAASDPLAVDVELAWCQQDQDRIDLALATCRAGLAQRPGAVRLLWQECWLLHDANDPGVGEHLAAVRTTLRSPLLDGLYASHCLEHGRADLARAIWTELLAEPHQEPRTRRMHCLALVRTCRDLGDDAAAHRFAAAAGRAGSTFERRLREFLATPAPRPRHRVVLPVPFVRQDHLTCSPATMACLLRTFGVVLDQREIAAQITYDGTASHDELAWARRRGLHVRYFQFDAEVARSLLDRGLPFAITTRFEANSHRQAVIGYDRVLGTFVLRDPTGNFRREVDAEWLDQVAGRGSDCALLLPESVARAHDLPALPQEAETMAWLQAQLDWRERRPRDAEQRAAALLQTATGPLRLDIELRVCRERGDRRRQLELWREAFARAPTDAYWQFHHAGELLDQNHWQEARTLLEGWLQKTRSPFLHNLLAEQWRHDARLRPGAERLVRRALRWIGRDAHTWNRLASIVRAEPARAELAAELSRIAACLAPHDEWLAMNCHDALRDLGRAAAGLQWLQERVVRLGGKSPAAAATLATALERQHRPDEARATLQAAIADREAPDERRILFHLLLRQHRLDEAEHLLAEPERMRPADHALARHALSRARGDHAAAQRALDDCVDQEPWHVRAQELRLAHLLDHHGAGAAILAADALCAAHADCTPLMIAIAEFFGRIEDHARAEALLRALVAAHPHEHWLRGRLSSHLVRRGRYDEARPLLDELRQSLPDSSPLWVDIGNVAHAGGDLAAARAAVRRAFELAPDHVGALHRLMDWAPDAAAAAADLRFVMERLAARPVAPDLEVLDRLSEFAAAVPRAEFLAYLEQLERNFPATTAPAVARCLLVGKTDPEAALPLAEAIVAREPWQSDHWLRHAAGLRACGRPADERAVLEQLLLRDPQCAQAYVELGDSLEKEGHHHQAMAVFERGLQHLPGTAVLHGMVAHTCWALGHRERALAAVARAGELDGSYAWALRARVRWLAELDRHAEALLVAGQVAADNPRWAFAHSLHATAFEAVGRHDERLAALRRALALSPRSGPPRFELLDALIEMRRFDEARATVAEGRALVADDPTLLLREAQIERAAGRIVAAREQLRAMLANLPDFRAGWVTLLEWCEEEGRHEDILLLHRQPPPALADEAVLFGYAADALRQRGDLAGADAALQRALELDPGYQWARDQRCTLALERDRPALVLDLLPDHGTPASLPFQRAVLVGKAASRLGKTELALATFARLLADPAARSADLGAVDELLRKRQGDAHAAALQRLVAGAAVGDPVHDNHLRVLAMRGDFAAFWAGLDRLVRGLGPERGVAAAAALLYDLQQRLPTAAVAKWVARNVRGPVRDTSTFGHLLFALSGEPHGDRECVRLFAADWRRPDVRGWMLANLADALRRLGRLSEMVEVSRHALTHVPHDHSYWWHRQYLAEAALAGRDLAGARELCVMPIDSFPSVRLGVHQIDLAAELRGAPFWQRGRRLRARLAEMFRRYDRARSDDRATLQNLRPGLLVRACPGPTTLLLCCGAAGVRIVRRVFRV